MPTFAHDGIRIPYLDRGAGLPLVFQHGLGGDMSQAGRYDFDRRLICLECRGHGGRHPLGPEDRLGFGTFADDVLALLDHLELETVDLAGVSMGAGIAARLAAEHPRACPPTRRSSARPPGRPSSHPLWSSRRTRTPCTRSRWLTP